MLNYLILVTENTVVAAIITGILYAYIPRLYGAKGRNILTIGVLAGLVLAAVWAVLKNTTKFIDITGGKGMWNVRIFSVSIVALILFYIFTMRKVQKKKEGGTGMFVPVFSAVLMLTLLIYCMPDVLAYPFNFTFNGTSVFSSDFFLRLVGYILGLLLVLLICLAANRTAGKLETEKVHVILNIILLINALEQVFKIIEVLHAKRVISSRVLFKLVTFTANHSKWFVYAALIAAFLIPLILFIRSRRVKEPYTNPAEHRKIKSKWRNIKRWSATLTCAFVAVVLVLTVLFNIDNMEVELSPVEECEVRDDSVYVSFEQVADGHLHRFAYTTPDGIDVRFIVIKKPNSSTYGIGLDACDICGETGYFERNGQIVCKLCDVVMNINTIGFKGGCNPIVIDYSLEDGYIVVPTYTLIDHQNEFK